MPATYPAIVITPNLKLDCTGLDVIQALNMFTIDSSVGTLGGGGVSLLPLADQTIAGPFTLVIAGGALQITPVLFSTLPAASASNEGMLRPILDSTTNTWGATITGGGTNHVLAYSDGTNWTVAAK